MPRMVAENWEEVWALGGEVTIAVDLDENGVFWVVVERGGEKMLESGPYSSEQASIGEAERLMKQSAGMDSWNFDPERSHIPNPWPGQV